MKYHIISINDERKSYKDNIRKHVPLPEAEWTDYNAYFTPPREGLAARGLEWKPDWPNPKIGEMGVWLSNYDAWKNISEMDSPCIVFEDDAVVDETFWLKFTNFIDQLPSDWDFAALWVPENQRVDYRYSLVYNHTGVPLIFGTLPYEKSIFQVPGADRAALVYQGYGMVSLVYSPRGAEKLVNYAHSRGITGPVDCWIYEIAHMDETNVKGYAPRPEYADIVTYDWAATSHVQLTERVE